MYRYSHKTSTELLTENETISLHDCHAERMFLESKTLSFYFPDGFWVAQGCDAVQKLYYTGEAQADFPLLYSVDFAVTIYVYTEQDDVTTRTTYTAETFMHLLNADGYSLEFLYAYIGIQTFRFDCWLHFAQEPYHRECELIIASEHAIYQWDAMYEEA